MNLGLAEKCTIITGGSGGIGRGLVLGFAEEGANIVIATRDGKKGQEVADAAAEFPGQVHVIPTDVTDADAVDAMVEATVERYGPVDVLVNNAGGVSMAACRTFKLLSAAARSATGARRFSPRLIAPSAATARNPLIITSLTGSTRVSDGVTCRVT